MCLTCNTCFRRPIRVHNPNDISIGLAIFAQLTVECHRARLGMFFPLTIAPSHKDLDPHLIRGSLSPSDSVSQTASRSVQPFLHSSRQSVPNTLLTSSPFTPQNCPFTGGSGPHLINDSFCLSPRPERHLDRFSRFCRAHDHDRQTDRQPSDRQTTLLRH